MNDMYNVLKKYPRTFDEFFSWMQNSFGADEYAYNSASAYDQAIAVFNFLGHPLKIPPGYTMPETIESLDEFLAEYEKLLIKYPEIPNTEKWIHHMSFKQLAEEFPDGVTPRTGLLSLKDALTLPEQPEHEKNKLFWSQAIKESRQESAPF